MTPSWESDLWGEVRRSIESSQATAQQSDALLAGARLSISSSVGSNYFALRQKKINQQLLDMIQSQYTQGVATNDQLLVVQDQLTTSIADLQTSLHDREQYEHALAVLVGVAPSESAVASRNDFTFVLPRPPLTLPSTLLLRRPDVVAAEHSAAANVRFR